ncbi:retrovirus-related pol polyprotein from transposon TNT 1-94 [Tanacetum coccineum]
MGDRHSFNSKEDQTQKISKSGFVTNFLDDYCAYDLWNVCVAYGKVIDIYIPVQKEPRNYVSQPKKVNEGIVKNSFATVMKTDINALSNLYLILANEGFKNVKLTHLGGFWVLLVVDSLASKEKIRKHVGFASWFNESIPASNLFVSEDRIVWVSIEGLPIKTLTRNTYAKIISPWGELIDVEDPDNMSFAYRKLEELGDSSSSDEEYEDDEEEQKSGNKENNFALAKEIKIDNVSESSCMHVNDLVYEKHDTTSEHTKKSEDPFGIYKILKKNKDKEESKVSSDKSRTNRVLKIKPGGSILEVMDELVKEKNSVFMELNSIINFQPPPHKHDVAHPAHPQSNGVVERKNRTLQEMSRTKLNEQLLSQKFWCNAVDTSTYILNRILIRAILGKTPYEILRGRKPTLDYFRVFGSKFFILNTKDYLTKFDPKSYEGFFLSYSQNSKAYIILNKHTRKIKESLNVTFDETPPPSKTSPLVDDDLDEEEAIREIEKKNLENNVEDQTLEIDEIVNIKESRNHPLENIIGNLNQRTLRSQGQNQRNFYCFISTIEPKNVNEALGDKS